MKFAATSGQTAAIVSEVGNRVGWGLGGGRVRKWGPHEKINHEMKTEMKNTTKLASRCRGSTSTHYGNDFSFYRPT